MVAINPRAEANSAHPGERTGFRRTCRMTVSAAALLMTALTAQPAAADSGWIKVNSLNTGAIQVLSDGTPRSLPAGSVLELAPGQSVTLMPGDWHAFWGQGGDVLVGEVSTVNDDHDDNIFRDPIGRFSAIEEDMEPKHLLVSDYESWLS